MYIASESVAPFVNQPHSFIALYCVSWVILPVTLLPQSVQAFWLHSNVLVMQFRCIKNTYEHVWDDSTNLYCFMMILCLLKRTSYLEIWRSICNMSNLPHNTVSKRHVRSHIVYIATLTTWKDNAALSLVKIKLTNRKKERKFVLIYLQSVSSLASSSHKKK